MIPLNPDWSQLFKNIETKAGLCPSAVCRVIKVNHAFAHRVCNDPSHNPRFDNAVKVINLHLQLLPDTPIPEKK